MATRERIQEIIEFVSTDAYTEDEVMGGWAVAFDDAAQLPFEATALGRPVTVHQFDAEHSRGVRCEIQGANIGRRWVGVDTLDPASLPEAVREVIEAFDAWDGGDY